MQSIVDGCGDGEGMVIDAICEDGGDLRLFCQENREGLG